jgi:hypothetical protein
MRSLTLGVHGLQSTVNSLSYWLISYLKFIYSGGSSRLTVDGSPTFGFYFLYWVIRYKVVRLFVFIQH